jgi:hypothetical protein
VRGWGVNILEDARHWIGLLQYNLSTDVAKRLRERGRRGGVRKYIPNHWDHTQWKERFDRRGRDMEW